MPERRRLGASAVRILRTLGAARPRIVPPARLLAALDHSQRLEPVKAPDQLVRTHIHHIRSVLGDDAVQTVWGLGYSLAPDVDLEPWLEASP